MCMIELACLTIVNSTNIIHMTTSVTQIYIMYNVQDYSVLYNNAVCLVICEGWHFTRMWKTLA